jgi:hypothetical protein
VLTAGRTMEQWAAAARRLDEHFGSAADRVRIGQRPEFPEPVRV